MRIYILRIIALYLLYSPACGYGSDVLVTYDQFKGNGIISSDIFSLKSDTPAAKVEGYFWFMYGKHAPDEPLYLNIDVLNGPQEFREAYDESSTRLDPTVTVSTLESGERQMELLLYVSKEEMRQMAKDDWQIKLYGDTNLVFTVPKRWSKKILREINKVSESWHR